MNQHPVTTATTSTINLDAIRSLHAVANSTEAAAADPFNDSVLENYARGVADVLAYLLSDRPTIELATLLDLRTAFGTHVYTPRDGRTSQYAGQRVDILHSGYNMTNVRNEQGEMFVVFSEELRRV